MEKPLGRTNEVFPPVWLSLSPPTGGSIQELVTAAVAAKTVIDISGSPALWGGHMRGTDALLMTSGGIDIERATDEKHAGDLIQAHLLETLSGIGREHIDFYFLRIRRALEEFQINGAVRALEMARQEGHIRFIGLSTEGPALAALGMWQFHDAFDALLTPRSHLDSSSYDQLAPMARERRVGVVTSKPLAWLWSRGPSSEAPPPQSGLSLRRGPGGGENAGPSLVQAIIADLAKDHPVLVSVRSAEEVTEAIQAPHVPRLENIDELLRPYLQRVQLVETAR